MAVRDIHSGGAKTPEPANISNPNANPQEKSVDDPTYWEGKARAEISKREYDEARRDRQQLASGHVPEPGIKVTGNIDVTEQSRILREEAKEQAAAATKKIEALSSKLDETKEQMIRDQIANYQKDTQAQLASLREILEKLTTEGKSFTDQVKDIKDAATTLGITTPITSTGNAQTDLTIQLEMIKLQHAENRANREFQWKMQMDERQHQLEIKRANDEADAKRTELDIKREHNQLVGSFPQMIGTAVAKGLTMHTGGEIAERPNQGKKQSYIIEAKPNEQGSVKCPGCKTDMMFGPTSEKAVCAQCNIEVPIKRAGSPETIPNEPTKPKDSYLYGPQEESEE